MAVTVNRCAIEPWNKDMFETLRAETDAGQFWLLLREGDLMCLAERVVPTSVAHQARLALDVIRAAKDM